MRVAEAKGRLQRRQPKLNARQEAHLVALHRAGEHSTGELSDLFGVGRSTVYQAIERDNMRRQLATLKKTPRFDVPHGNDKRGEPASVSGVAKSAAVMGLSQQRPAQRDSRQRNLKRDEPTRRQRQRRRARLLSR